MSKILLPNNGFGVLLMLLAIFTVITVPFVISYWLTSLIAPWWVSFPVSFAITLFVFLKCVKFKQ